MKQITLICGLSCTPISASAYVDYICELASGTDSYVIDLSGQTITQAGSDPRSFEDTVLTAFPLIKTMKPIHVGRMDAPHSDHIVPGGFTGFALAENTAGELLFFENFSDPVDYAFAPIAEVMERTNGIPCVAAEAD